MSYTEQQIQSVWEKGTPVGGIDKNIHRKDAEGNLIQRDKYGDRDHDYGWEIDHIVPKSKGGGDSLGNLQPLQWEANINKSDDYVY